MNEPETNFPAENPETTVWELMTQIDIDPLTGLPNRNRGLEQLTKQISRAKGNNEKIGLVFIDLDNFKPINENYNHEYGDQILVEVTSALKESFRPSDYLVRYGGDEFYAICPGMAEENRIKIEKRIREKIQEKLSKREDFKTKPELGKIGATIGNTFWDGIESPTDFVNRTDRLMYEIKREKHKPGYNYEE